MVDDEQKNLIEQATGDAYDAMRAACHAVQGQSISAPVAYEVLGGLQGAGGYVLAQVLQQLSQGLQRSLTDPGLIIGEDDGSNPAPAVNRARHLLDQGAALAVDLADVLSEAQAALSTQSVQITATHVVGHDVSLADFVTDNDSADRDR